VSAARYPGRYVDEGSATIRAQPGLIFFFSGSSGICRRVEAFLAQVLQRRANHDTFKVYSVDVEKHPELARRFRVDETPVLCVVEDKSERARLNKPKSSRDIERFLAPWLQ
jgi:thioredoxin-like negative regulator of GroEL